MVEHFPEEEGVASSSLALGTKLMVLESQPVRKEEIPGFLWVKEIESDGYQIYFSDLECAKNFVRLFWWEDDTTSGRDPQASCFGRFEKKMWRPELELTCGCRTRILNPDSEDEQKGAKAVVFVSGNGNPLQMHARQALEKLIDLN